MFYKKYIIYIKKINFTRLAVKLENCLLKTSSSRSISEVISIGLCPSYILKCFLDFYEIKNFETICFNLSKINVYP